MTDNSATYPINRGMPNSLQEIRELDGSLLVITWDKDLANAINKTFFEGKLSVRQPFYSKDIICQECGKHLPNVDENKGKKICDECAREIAEEENTRANEIDFIPTENEDFYPNMVRADDLTLQTEVAEFGEPDANLGRDIFTRQVEKAKEYGMTLDSLAVKR
jgi:hypothetical protein